MPTGAEIAPEGFVECALAAARAALAEVDDAHVVGLGVSGMAETGVLLGRDGEPVVPSIAWHDSRGEDEARRIDAEIPGFRGHHRAVGAARCARWRSTAGCATTCPRAQRGTRWLSVGEWVVHRLGGEQGAELSLASRTGWLDLHSRGWWDATVEWSGAPAGLLPEPAFAGTPLGRAGDLLPAARGAVLAVGGHDHLSAAVGAGAVGEGDVLDSWGTAEALVRSVAPLDRERVQQAVDDDIMVGWHAVPERQNLLGAMRSGAALGRVLALLGVGPEGRDALERAALEVEPEGIELIGLNDYRVGLVNIGADPSPAVVWRAALESAGKAARDLLDKMARVAGPHTRLVMAGGWSEGVAARAIKEAHIGPFERSQAVFMGARGAALTAGRAAGWPGALRPGASGRSAHTVVCASRCTPQCSDSASTRFRPSPPLIPSGTRPRGVPTRPSSSTSRWSTSPSSIARTRTTSLDASPACRTLLVSSSVTTSSASPSWRSSARPASQPRRTARTSSADSGRARTFICSGLTTSAPPLESASRLEPQNHVLIVCVPGGYPIAQRRLTQCGAAVRL